MSIAIMTVVWAVKLPHADKIVLLALADNANDEGFCWPSVTTLAAKCGMSRRSVERVVDRLQTEGHLKRRERSGRSNTYTIHPRPSVTPDLKSPLTNGHTPPDPQSSPPPTHSQGTCDRPSPITIIEPPIESPMNRKSTPRRTSRVPEDFVPDLSYARTQIPDIDAEREAQRFRDWEFKTPRSDWPAAWRIWIGTCRDKGQYAKARGETMMFGGRPVEWQ